MRMLRASGAESEALLAFAAAADLLLPIRDHFASLPDVQREALEISLALRPGTVTSPLAVCAAALGALAAAGEETPLLILVDDFQWLDPQSQQLLLFIARRVATERMTIILTMRTDGDPSPIPPELATLHLPGLSVPEARELATALDVTITDAVLDQLVDRTAGNPLAIVETLTATPPSSLSERSFRDPEIGPSLRRAWSSVVSGFTAQTAVALFTVAASRSADPVDLEPVLDDLGLTLTDLAPAERATLLAVRPERIELRHPLVRDVIIAHTPVVEQLRVYRALAGRAHGHLRTWYLAACTAAPNDDVAALLAAAAADARDRGDHRTSAQTWGRAADFTTTGRTRAQRLLSAATEALLGGDSRSTISRCEDAAQIDNDPRFTANVEIVRARAHVLAGRTRRAVDVLTRAAEGIAATDSAAAAHLYAEAIFPCGMSGRVPEMQDIADRCLALSGADHPPLPVAASAAAAFAVSGRIPESRAIADGIDIAATPPLWDLHFLFFAGTAHILIEQFDRAGAVLRHVVDVARRAGAPMTLAATLTTCAQLGWWTGTWTQGYADGAEALRWAEELEQLGIVGVAEVNLGRIDAARGDSARCRLRMDRARQAADAYELGSMEVYVPAVLGLDALGSGSTDEAVDHLDRAWTAARASGLACPTAVPFAGDLIEAHIRAGDHDTARAALRWATDEAATTGLAFAQAVVERYYGLLATDLTTARAHFARAHAAHDRVPVPFERARTLLCEGESLRRLRRRSAARWPLNEALRIFDQLGARPWSRARASNWRRRGSATSRRPSPARPSTP
ncbi:hypothetical protein BJF90_35055 [Pseudonocardia sp. CNS-004]|nr:hypothetical protein BJF90_35055 [Pseudonocardia sp. CNS-004]